MEDSADIIRRAKYPAPTMKPRINENGHHEITVPGDGTSGNQVFLAATIEGLCSKLATAQWYGTQKIRQLGGQLKVWAAEQEEEAERRFAARQAQGFYDEF